MSSQCFKNNLGLTPMDILVDGGSKTSSLMDYGNMALVLVVIKYGDHSIRKWESNQSCELEEVSFIV